MTESPKCFRLAFIIERLGNKTCAKIAEEGNAEASESLRLSIAKHNLEMWKSGTTSDQVSTSTICKVRPCKNLNKRNAASLQIEGKKEKRIP